LYFTEASVAEFRSFIWKRGLERNQKHSVLFFDPLKKYKFKKENPKCVIMNAEELPPRNA
jgi:hypothetical protein